MAVIRLKLPKKPRIKRTVESTLASAMDRARAQAWDKVIIIGQGPVIDSLSHSRMTKEQIIGLLEISKYAILTD